MPEYRYIFDSFDEDETVEIPGDAIGVTVGSFSDFATVRYLVPDETDE